MTLDKHPRLVVQSFKNEVGVYDYFNNKWHIVHVLSDFNYNLLKAYGQYIIGSNPDSHKVKLFETTEGQPVPIASEIDLAEDNRPKQVDVINLDQMSILKYDIEGRNFEFQKWNAAKLIYHTDKKFLEQICGSNLICLKKDMSVGFFNTNFNNN